MAEASQQVYLVTSSVRLVLGKCSPVGPSGRVRIAATLTAGRRRRAAMVAPAVAVVFLAVAWQQFWAPGNDAVSAAARPHAHSGATSHAASPAATEHAPLTRSALHEPPPVRHRPHTHRIGNPRSVTHQTRQDMPRI